MGWSEILIIAVVLLIVIGPDKLPQFARSAGRMYGQIRRTADEMRRALVLEADRQDAEKRYEEMMERRRRADEERRKAAEANPGVEAQQEHLPGTSAPEASDQADSAADPDALALGASDTGDHDLGHVAHDGDQDLQSLLDDPNGPYAAGRSLDDVIHQPQGDVLTGTDGTPIPAPTDRAPEDLPFATPAAVEGRPPAGARGAQGPPADLPPGVSAQEWAELPEHIKAMLRERAGGDAG